MKYIKRINEMFDEFNDSERFNNEQYWESVASELGGTLEKFDIEEYRRIIVIDSSTYGKVEIIHDWGEDGTSTKPWTYVNGDDTYGRIAIWDDPSSYAEDIIYVLDRMSKGSGPSDEEVENLEDVEGFGGDEDVPDVV
jgi:hypothetical protein